eukprot:5374873-Prorocentrum_lima.AAC.1
MCIRDSCLSPRISRKGCTPIPYSRRPKAVPVGDIAQRAAEYLSHAHWAPSDPHTIVSHTHLLRGFDLEYNDDPISLLE